MLLKKTLSNNHSPVLLVKHSSEKFEKKYNILVYIALFTINNISALFSTLDSQIKTVLLLYAYKKNLIHRNQDCNLHIVKKGHTFIIYAVQK